VSRAGPSPNTWGTLPDWLTNYLHQPAALGLLHADGSIWGGDGEAILGLSYHAEQGIIIDRTRIQWGAEETDEYCD